MGKISVWKNIIWREWRHTEDEEFAQHLFELVAEEAVGWRLPASLGLLFTVGAAGTGLFLGLILLVIGIFTIPTSQILVWITFTIFSLAGIISLGAILGLLMGIPLGRNIYLARP